MKLPAIAPSLMCMDLTRFGEQISFFNGKIAYFHIDIMDGHFVPNITLSPYFVGQLKKLAIAPIDCHLMVTRPENYVASLAAVGSSMISFHAETANGLAFRLINQIRSSGMQCGLVLNPETALEQAALYLDLIDKVTVMTVDPGFAGQPFIPGMLRKISQLRDYRRRHQLDFRIEIDGACNKTTYAALVDAGADILVLGSSGLFNHNEDIAIAWRKMQQELTEALTH
jgi:D-allulose-6-phosphate 3-epimerase